MTHRLTTLYMPIEKVNHEQRIVYGVATSETPDSEPGIYKGERFEGDIIDIEAIRKALPDYLEFGNVREMHGPRAAGKTVEAEIIGKALHIGVKVVDDQAWKKVVEQVYNGFSIGARATAARLEKVAGKTVRRITGIQLREISLVDRPANPDALFTLWKGFAMDEELLKAADPAKAVALLQALRNESELSGDLEGAQLITQAISLVMQAGGEAKEPKTDETAETPEQETTGEPIALAAGRTLTIRKAGRAFSGANATAMHDVIKTLSAMLAGAGDETAAKVQACYGQAQPSSDEPDMAEKLAKVMGGAVSELGDTITKSLTNLAARLDVLERQPAAGGPVVRNVAEKTLATSTPSSGELRKAQIADLRKRAASEPDPIKKAELQRQLTNAERGN